MRVSVIQMNSQNDKVKNLSEAERLIESAIKAEHHDLVVLPETFTFMGGNRQEKWEHAENFPEGEAYRLISSLAAKFGVFIHAGSMAERVPDDSDQRCFNTTVVFNRQGEQVALYRKIHLFDVEVPGGVRYMESEAIAHGEDIVTYDLDGITTGCTICYDLRFPELYKALREKGSKIIVVPAAFTLQTGKDHWQVLLQARAIETQCYIVAANQVFTHNQGKLACYGHSMIIDPWGCVIARCSEKTGHVSADIDFNYQEVIRKTMPVASHHRLKS